MSLFIPSLLLCAGVLLAVRHRAWRGTAALLATSLALCGATSEPSEDDPSVTLGVGGASGSYREACGPLHRYGSVAVDAEYRKEVARNTDFTADLRVNTATDAPVYGTGTTGPPPVVTPARSFRWSAQPMVGLDHTWVGGAIGTHLGQISFLDDSDTVPAFPAARFRIGPRSVLFLDGGLADHFAGSFPSGFLRAGLGVGLLPQLHDAAWNHPVLKLGIADSGFYLNPEVALGPRLRLDLFGSYGDPDFWRFALGVRYQLALVPPGSTR